MKPVDDLGACPKDVKSVSRSPLDIPSIDAKLKSQGGKRLWRSLEELAGTPEFHAYLHNEFPHDPADEPPSANNEIGRRDVLRLMAASAALSGLTSCTKLPTERILPYVKQPEVIIPGKPLFYATSMPAAEGAVGLLVETHTGRPTKVEGNPQHPASLGAADIFCQSSVLSLYDPDRSRAILHEGRISDPEDFRNAMNALVNNFTLNHGSGLAVLMESTTSPSLASQIQALVKQFPTAKVYVHEPCGPYNAREGGRLAFGDVVNTVYRFDQADVVVSLDSDFISTGSTCVRHAHDFAARRNVTGPQSTMNRLYMVESTPSNTGAMADHRLPLRCGEIQYFARSLAAAAGLPVAAGRETVPAAWLAALARDLQKNRGSSLIIAGESQPPYVHALVHNLNDKLGNVGKTVVYVPSIEAIQQPDSLPDLVKEIDAGRVKVLLILGSNPVYTAPVDLQFPEKLLKVGLRIHLGLYDDETSELCHWHIPQAYFMESWSDARAYDGTVSIIQPLIAPLYNGLSAHEVLALFAGDSQTTAHDLIRNYWKAQKSFPSDQQFETFWETTLYYGVMADTAFTPITASPHFDYSQLPSPGSPPASEQIEIVFRPDPTIGDGRWANNSWLQELPKPLTKLTWDNALMLSPMTAWRLGLTDGDIVNLSVGPWKVSGPIFTMPGHADNSATMPLGYGRRRAGRVGSGVGLNGYLVRTSNMLQAAPDLKIEKTPQTYLFATTQIHHPIDQNGEQVEEESVNAFKRDLVRIATLAEFRANPNFAAEKEKENVEGLSMYQPYKYEGYAWGMSIDLNRCTGCSACVSACYAENNIAVVGKYEVMAGRDMQWIRVDNYYRGDLKNPETYFEPLPCMHCEQAPCELVCPVGATLHSSEGLNEMIYNRCVGTRYCSNNCPYKVRRFNFKLYSDWTTPSLYGVRNPNVTVRSRGVMEKCSYCVQRINAAKIQSDEEGRTVRDGEIKTACQQTCPTEAIIFGNINDPNSRVSRLKASSRDYSLLAELNTRPRTTYLGKLRNPNPEIGEV